MSNEFKLFGAGGSSPNTLSPSAWAALTTLLGSGFASGVADSKQFNTLFRQCSTVAAGIGQFIANQGGNANDDGSAANFAAAFKAALGASSLAASGYQVLPSGLIVQWGNGSTNGSGVATVTFPLAFPTAMYQLIPTARRSSALSNSVGWDSTTSLTSATVFAASAAVTGFDYIAFGK